MWMLERQGMTCERRVNRVLCNTDTYVHVYISCFSVINLATTHTHTYTHTHAAELSGVCTSTSPTEESTSSSPSLPQCRGGSARRERATTSPSAVHASQAWCPMGESQPLQPQVNQVRGAPCGLGHNVRVTSSAHSLFLVYWLIICG